MLSLIYGLLISMQYYFDGQCNTMLHFYTSLDRYCLNGAMPDILLSVDVC